MIDWNIKKNLRYLIPTLIVFLLIPHLVMCAPGLSGELSGWIVSDQAERATVLYDLVVWLMAPLAGAIITLWRVMKGEQFSFLLPVAAEVSILTYLLRFDVGGARGPVLALTLGPLLMLLMECFALLGHYGGANRLLTGAASNCRFLTLLAFLLVGLPGVFGISTIYSCAANLGGIPGAVTSIAGGLFKGIPFLLILMFLPVYQAAKDETLTLGGAVGVLLLYLPTALVWSIDSYRFYNLIFITLGFALLFLMEGFIALVRWTVERISAKRGGAPG